VSDDEALTTNHAKGVIHQFLMTASRKRHPDVYVSSSGDDLFGFVLIVTPFQNVVRPSIIAQCFFRLTKDQAASRFCIERPLFVGTTTS
jgi:hypothetical protein